MFAWNSQPNRATWVDGSGSAISTSYEVVNERPGMARIELVQIQRDGRSCDSHPTCEHGIEPLKVMALAMLHAKVTNI